MNAEALLFGTSGVKCRRINKMIVDDGLGAETTVWADGSEFLAVINSPSSTIDKIAMAQGVKSLYTIITNSDIVLKFPEIIQRISDGKHFKITDSGERTVPEGATMQVRKVSAEEWHMPKDGEDE